MSIRSDDCCWKIHSTRILTNNGRASIYSAPTMALHNLSFDNISRAQLAAVNPRARHFMHITLQQQTRRKGVKRFESIKKRRTKANRVVEGERLNRRSEDLLHHKMCLNMSIKTPCKTSATKEHGSACV